MATLKFPVSANALFASSLQPSDQPDPAQVRVAITVTFDALGDTGCAARVAQEFGDHPETAVSRMRWARAATAGTPARPEPAQPARPEPARPSRSGPRYGLSGVPEGHLPSTDVSFGSVGVRT